MSLQDKVKNLEKEVKEVKEKSEFTIERQENMFIINLDFLKTIRLSDSEKSFTIATTGGYIETDVLIDGLPVSISINVTTPNLNYALTPKAIEKITEDAIKKEQAKINRRLAKFKAQGVTIKAVEESKE